MVAPANAGFPAVPLISADRDAWARHIDPDRDESGELPWLPDLASGMRDADRSDRPLFAWIGIQHPNRCVCPGDLLGDRADLEDPEVRELLREFVLASASRDEAQSADDPWSSAFRWAAATPDGRYAGQVASGFYAVTPRGELLARCRTFHKDELLDAITAALEAWFELTPVQRRRSDAPPSDLAADMSTQGIQAFTCTARTLPVTLDPSLSRYPSFHRGELWLDVNDRARLVPDGPTGTKANADAVAAALARWSFLDPESPVPFSADDVQLAALTVSVAGEDGSRLRLTLEGVTFALAESGRGVHTRIDGTATYDASTDRFTDLHLVAIGHSRAHGRAPRAVGWVVRPSPAWRALRVTPRFDSRFATHP